MINVSGLKPQAGESAVGASAEDKLASLLTIENLDLVSKIVSIARRLNELGILDLVNDLLSDEEFLREVFNQVLTTDNVVLLTNIENLVKLLAKLSDKRVTENLIKAVVLLNTLGNGGLTDALNSLLSNGEVAKSVSNLLLNPSTQDLIKSVSNLAATLSSIKLEEAVKLALEEAKAGESTPTVTIIRRLLTDPNVKRGLMFMIGLLEGIGRQLK